MNPHCMTFFWGIFLQICGVGVVRIVFTARSLVCKISLVGP